MSIILQARDWGLKKSDRRLTHGPLRYRSEGFEKTSATSASFMNTTW